MPRRSVAELSIARVPGERPSAPADLSGPELEIWEELTAGLLAERIDSAFVVLARVLVQHIRYCRFWGDAAERMLEAGGLDDPKQRQTLRTIMRAHGEQSEKVGMLMTRLRMTPQSRYVADKASLHKPGGVRPWEDWSNDPKPPRAS